MVFSIRYADFVSFFLVKRMMGLNDDRKIELYKNEFKDTARNCLNETYKGLKPHEKLNFYNDAFECLGFYETDFLLLNLFYEDDCFDLLNLILIGNGISEQNLSKNNFLANEMLKYSTLLFEKSKLKVGIQFSIHHLNKIMDQDILKLVENARENENPFVTKYAKFLISNINDNFDTCLFSIHLFTKLCEHFGYVASQNTRKALIYFSVLINMFDVKVKERIWVKLFDFDVALKLQFKGLFSNHYKSFGDDEYNLNNNPAFISKLQEYRTRITLSKVLNDSYENNSYVELFDIMESYYNEAVIDRISKEIFRRIYNHDFPSLDDLSKINQKKFIALIEEDIKKKFFKTLYYY